MSTYRISWRRALVCLFSLVFALLAAAQDPTGPQLEGAGRAGEKIARTDWRPSPMALARNLLHQYEFVGVGEFLHDALPASDELNPRTLTLTFQVDTTYKKPDLPAIEVELNSDMLIATGEQVSRYAKRQKVWKEFSQEGERNKNTFDELEASLKAGRLTQAEYDRRKGDLESAERERHKQVASLIETCVNA